jgi:hypothetical protein
VRNVELEETGCQEEYLWLVGIGGCSGEVFDAATKRGI